MTAFIFSGLLAFAIYELLAFAKWPPTRTPPGLELPFVGGSINFDQTTERTVYNVLRAVIVMAILLAVLLVHYILSPVDILTRYSVNIIFGFLFGTLFAIWINSVALHSPWDDLTRGHIIAGIGLVLLFFLGAFGDRTAEIIGQFAHHLSSLKIGGAELSFAPRDRNDRDRIGSIGIPDLPAEHPTYVSGGSNGLPYLVQLDEIIKRDQNYMRLFAANGPIGRPDAEKAFADLNGPQAFAKDFIVSPLACLAGRLEQTADSGPVDRYLRAYVDALRRLQAVYDQINPGDGQTNAIVNQTTTSVELSAQDPRLRKLSKLFTRNSLAMALDLAASTPATDMPADCKAWLGSGWPDCSGSGPALLQCLHALQVELKNLDTPSSPPDGKVASHVALLADKIRQFIDGHGLRVRPYFATMLASCLAQLGEYEGAASVLDNWLRQQRDDEQRAYEQQQEDNQEQSADQQQKDAAAKQKQRDKQLMQIENEWFALRVRSFLAAYVEEWLQKSEAKAPTVVEDEHLENLQAIRLGFKQRLMRADFFRRLDRECDKGCTPALRQPGPCSSNEPHDDLLLWQSLYTSFATMEATYVYWTLRHPDYPNRFAETTNQEAQQLANFDLSCGAKMPRPEVIYAQSLLNFAENNVEYSRFRAATGNDSESERNKRLDEAERAARFGLEIIARIAEHEAQRHGHPYLERVRPSFAVDIQQRLKIELGEVDRTRRELAD